MIEIITPKKVRYSVVKNNKTPNGPISVGDVKVSIRIRTASPMMLMDDIIRLCFIFVLYHIPPQEAKLSNNFMSPPDGGSVFLLGEVEGLSGATFFTIGHNPDSTLSF